MIEFSGEFSQTSKNYLLKKNAIIGLLVSLFTSTIFGLAIIIIAIIYDLWIISLFFIVLALFILLATTAPYIQKKNTLRMLIPKTIIIDVEHIYYDLEKASISKSLCDVKKVIDYGEWYLIKFHFPKLDGFLCQKSLLKKGTFEDFEKLFRDKIVRRKIKN